MSSSSEKDKKDRRDSDRFPIERDIRYKVLGKRSDEVGVGKTLNISSSGILFTKEHLLVPGKRLEVTVNWPVSLNNKCNLNLIARGRVVRTERGKAAIKIQQYEFRTALGAAQPLPV